jgi:molybdopterin/thiamine biosynthesis adenylyltransferase
MNISEEELEIFSRQLILNEFSEKSFIKIQNKKISIIGMGGIGCPLAQYLVSCGVKNLNIFDNDIIKKHNLNRQNLFTLKDLGQKKVVIAKNRLDGINSSCNIFSYDKKITTDNIECLKDSSIIIDATDNWANMRMINEYSLKNNIPLLSASASGFSIQIILFENNKNKHLCLECVFPNKTEPKLSRCDSVGILGTVAGIAGLIGAQKIINFIMNFDNNNNILTLIDCKDLSINHIKVNKRETCNFSEY